MSSELEQSDDIQHEDEDNADESMYLTVNALLGDSIDSYAWRFQTLQESQQAIGAQLDLILKRLEKYSEEMKDSNRINTTIEKIRIIKKRLKSTNFSLEITKKRLDSINN